MFCSGIQANDAQRRIIAFYLDDYNTSVNYFENKF